jgi:hypothetical protein
VSKNAKNEQREDMLATAPIEKKLNLKVEHYSRDGVGYAIAGSVCTKYLEYPTFRRRQMGLAIALA